VTSCRSGSRGTAFSGTLSSILAGRRRPREQRAAGRHPLARGDRAIGDDTRERRPHEPVRDRLGDHLGAGLRRADLPGGADVHCVVWTVVLAARDGALSRATARACTPPREVSFWQPGRREVRLRLAADSAALRTSSRTTGSPIFTRWPRLDHHRQHPCPPCGRDLRALIRGEDAGQRQQLLRRGLDRRDQIDLHRGAGGAFGRLLGGLLATRRQREREARRTTTAEARMAAPMMHGPCSSLRALPMKLG